MVFQEGQSMRHMCTVTWFLSLAFADGVFKNLFPPSGLGKVTPPPGSYLVRVQYIEIALQRPFLRGIIRDASISTMRIWTYDCFNALLGKLF
jgi:hypothetical protein